MSDDHDRTDEQDPRVLSIARDFLAELEAGRWPDREHYIARFPELRAELEECFDGIELAAALSPRTKTSNSSASAAEADADLVQPLAPLGDFQIVRRIARGGMGVVYEAIQLSLGRRVALKVLPFAAALNERHLQRFKIESQAAAQLHHTNIVPIYAVGCERGIHFYAMQLIEGRSLGEVIEDWRQSEREPARGSISPPRSSQIPAETVAGTTLATAASRRARWTAATRIIAEVADALEFAHSAGVVHRDIKPANILLDNNGRVWVTDFGLAHVATDVSLTRSGEMLGTLRYMSPEQASGQRGQVDHRTDIYSLGATLYEALTLRPVFVGDDRATLLMQILREEPRPIRQIDRNLPVELETITLMALAKNPADRYSSAAEFADDLRRFLSQRPILAQRPTWADHARKCMRRHPGFVVAVGLIGLISAAVFAVASALILREQALTAAALKRERERTIQAESRLALAQRAADDLIQLAEDEALDHPFQEGLRTQLLETALEYYQQIIDERQDRPEDQALLEQTRDRVEMILDDLATLRADRQFFLLRDPDVLRDLGTSDEQRQALRQVLGELPTDVSLVMSRALFPPPDGPPGKLGPPRSGPPDGKNLGKRHPYPSQNFGEQRLPSREDMIRIARDHQQRIRRILTEQQMARIDQIALQIQGPFAFRDYETAKRLDLSREQQASIRRILAIKPRGVREPRRKGDRPAMSDEDGSTLQQILDLLTPTQRRTWEEMCGPPFVDRSDENDPNQPKFR